MKRVYFVALLLALTVAAALIGLRTGPLAADSPSEKVGEPAAVVVDASKFPGLQAAFDAVPASGGLVKLPPGRFELSSPLVLSRQNTRVVGCGAATHLVNRNEDGLPALIVRPPDKPAAGQSRIWRVQLADFRISGNPGSGDGLLAQGINEIYIHGLSIDHNGGHGINLIDCYEDPRVCDSIITYNAQAGLNILRGHDIVVNGNQFEENLDAARCIDSFNLCFDGNNLDDHLGHGVVVENTYGSVLSGNMIEECKGIAVVMDRDCYGNAIGANVLAHNFGGGVDLRDAWGCAVSANTLTMDTPFGVRVGPGSGRITISGNNFSNAHIGGKNKREDAAAGVLLVGAADVVVSGNLFGGLARYAVQSDRACRRIAITGNVMTDLHRAGEADLPPMETGGARETLIEHNILPSP